MVVAPFADAPILNHQPPGFGLDRHGAIGIRIAERHAHAINAFRHGGGENERFIARDTSGRILHARSDLRQWRHARRRNVDIWLNAKSFFRGVPILHRYLLNTRLRFAGAEGKLIIALLRPPHGNEREDYDADRQHQLAHGTPSKTVLWC